MFSDLKDLGDDTKKQAAKERLDVSVEKFDARVDGSELHPHARIRSQGDNEPRVTLDVRWRLNWCCMKHGSAKLRRIITSFSEQDGGGHPILFGHKGGAH